MRFRRGLLFLTILLMLAGEVLAAPRIALLIPIEGRCSLNGEELSAPQLASEGQILILKAEAKLRVKTLRSPREFIVEGPAELTLRARDLASRGESLSRGTVKVVKDIGSLNIGASDVIRDDTAKPSGLKFVLPPEQQEDGTWIWEVLVTPEELNTHGIEFGVIAVMWHENGKSEEDVVKLTDLFDDFPGLDTEGGDAYFRTCPESVKVGRPGRIAFQLSRGVATEGYQRHYRLLSTEDQEAIDTLSSQILASSDTQVSKLLRLAEVQLCFQQMVEADSLLRRARELVGDGHELTKSIDRALWRTKVNLDYR